MSWGNKGWLENIRNQSSEKYSPRSERMNNLAVGKSGVFPVYSLSIMALQKAFSLCLDFVSLNYGNHKGKVQHLDGHSYRVGFGSLYQLL